MERELRDLALRLEDERPLPRPGFRGDLRRHLIGRPGPGLSPGRARVLARLLTAAGLAMLAVVAVGLGGAGPLAPG